jgi:hypothetical protein
MNIIDYASEADFVVRKPPSNEIQSQLHLTLLIQFFAVVNAKYRFQNMFWSFVGYDAM